MIAGLISSSRLGNSYFFTTSNSKTNPNGVRPVRPNECRWLDQRHTVDRSKWKRAQSALNVERKRLCHSSRPRGDRSFAANASSKSAKRQQPKFRLYQGWGSNEGLARLPSGFPVQIQLVRGCVCLTQTVFLIFMADEQRLNLPDQVLGPDRFHQQRGAVRLPTL